MKKLTLSLFILWGAQSFAAPINSQALNACSLIDNDFKRLLCYDHVVAGKSLDASATAVTATPAKSSQAQSEPADKFGLEHKNVTKDAAESQTAVVKKVKKAPHGELIMTLENGQVWRQVGTARLKVKEGSTVVIKRGALSSFLLKLESSNKTIRVKRTK